MKSGENPKNFKILLAKEIVSIYNGKKEAQNAEEEFNKIFSKKELPSEIEIFQTQKINYSVLDLLCDAKLSPSKNEAKRLVEGGAVSIKPATVENLEEASKITDWRQEIKLEDGMVIQVGKRRFIKIKLT